MFRLILIVLLNLFGYNIHEPVRLEKKVPLKEKINTWAEVHQYELLLIITILMMVIFVIVVFACVPPMDMWNNHFNEVI